MNFSKFDLLRCISTFLFKSKTALVCAVILLAFSFSLVFAQDIGAPPEPVKKIIAQAKELKAAGKIDEALDLLNSGREKYPESLHLCAEIYLLLIGTKRYEDCLDFINETLPTTPEQFKKSVLAGKRGVLLSLFWQDLEEKLSPEDYSALRGFWVR